MRSINLVVLHCTGSPNGVFVTPAQIDAWHRERGFIRDPKFSSQFRPELTSIGYHRVVLADGSIAAGRELDEIGAHVKGYNIHSIGICMVGVTAFFASQWRALRVCLADVALAIARDRGVDASAVTGQSKPGVRALGNPLPSPDATIGLLNAMSVRVAGHRDLSPDVNHDGVIEPSEWLKICPGFDVKGWLDREMEPEDAAVLDDHPAIATADPASRAFASLRYGVS